MPSEDSLAEPVPTAHFTGQRGWGLRMGTAPTPPHFTLSYHHGRCQVLCAICVLRTRGSRAEWE
jgi:hypothetical protein